MTNVIFTPLLADAFAQAGFVYPDNADGDGISRFSTNGNKQDKAGWLNTFPDGKGAVFGCWRSGESYTWQQRIDGQPMPSGDELKQAKIQAAKARKQAEQEREEVYSETAKMLLAEREGLPLATDEHGYVQAKGIKLHGDVRLGQKGQLNIRVDDGDGNLISVQDIYSPSKDGKSFKKFATDAKMKGGRVVFGDLRDGNDITLFEGYATAASGYESGIGACVCCFSGSNLALVAADLRKRYPNSFIRIGGDFDSIKPESAKYAKAAEAEAMPNSITVFPVFSDGRNDGDFNDLHQFAGLAEVHKQLTEHDRAGGDLSGLNSAVDTNPLHDMQAFDKPALPVVDARDGTEFTRPLTEYGNAQRLLDLHGGILRYVPEIKAWIVWRDGSYHWDTTGAIVRSLAGGIAKSIYAEGADFDMTQATYFAKWARTSQSSHSIDAAVSLLSDQGRIRLALAMIDADPMLIGFDHAKQVIDLRTGRIRTATQADYITKSLTPCTLGDAVKAVRWQSFLTQIFNGDAQLIDWLHRWCGYLLTGSTNEQILLFFFGLGANGKSVFAELLKYLIGDYGRSVASETLTETKRQAGGASPDLADLLGCRLAMSNETEDGRALAESLIKSITGGDTITARQMYKDFFQFTPAFKLLMLGNHRPIVHGTDHGIWRRIRLVPFMRTFAEQERDPQLLDKLKAEAPHILAWMVQGCIEWQRRGLGDVPDVVANQTADYRQEQDVIGQWLGECTQADHTVQTLIADIYSNYRNWAIESGLRPAPKIALGRRLTERGFARRKSNGVVFWAGIRLNSNNNGGYSYGK